MVLPKIVPLGGWSSVITVDCSTFTLVVGHDTTEYQFTRLAPVSFGAKGNYRVYNISAVQVMDAKMEMSEGVAKNQEGKQEVDSSMSFRLEYGGCVKCRQGSERPRRDGKGDKVKSCRKVTMSIEKPRSSMKGNGMQPEAEKMAAKEAIFPLNTSEHLENLPIPYRTPPQG